MTTRILSFAIIGLAILASHATMEAEVSSLLPSASPAPSYVGVDRFDWDLDRVGNVEVEFSNADVSEIKLHYNISIRDTEIRAFEVDCTTPLLPTVTTLSSETVIVSPTHADFTVNVDIAQDNVTASPIWSDVGDGEGLISMCVRVDLVLDDTTTSVNFHETKLFISISMVQGFEVVGIDLNRINATTVTDEAVLDYNVTACQCDEFGTCGSSILTQGSDVWICVKTEADNLEIAEVRELTMTQGTTFSTTPIVAGVEDPLTRVTLGGDGKEVRIRYQIISAFFSDPDPEDIVASGSVLMVLTDGNARRLMRDIKVVQRERELEEDVNEAFDDVRITLESSQAESSSTVAGSFASMIVIVVGGMVAVV